MESKVLYKIRIRGFVQGVGFRWNAAREARNNGITGYVENMPDGSVYIEAEGFREKLNEYMEWCRGWRGYVESVTVDTFTPVNYIDFKIKY